MILKHQYLRNIGIIIDCSEDLQSHIELNTN
mgnify:CR=1 FL=1